MKPTECCIISLLIFFITSLHAQDCVDYHNLGDCKMVRQRGYKT